MQKPEWHIWVIKVNKFSRVESHLKDIPEIEEVLYPTVTKEYKSTSGKTIKKRAPLYSGYLFLKYVDNPVTYHHINICPFITTYVGKCSGEDLKNVYRMRDIEYINTVNKRVSVDDRVRINSGPFKGFDGTVTATSSNNITVLLHVFGRATPVNLDQDDADIVERT